MGEAGVRVDWSELSGRLLEAVPDPFIGVDGEGLVVFANGLAERAFGCPRQEMLGRPVTLLLPDVGTGIAGGTAPADRPGPPSMARHRDGGTFPVELRFSTMPTDGAMLTCLTVRDISDQLRDDAEHARLRVEAARHRVEAHLHRSRRMESLERLAGRVAHDFNNLLGVIANYAVFVIEEVSVAQPHHLSIAQDARQIVLAGERGAELTRRLLSFAGRDATPPQPVDVNQRIAAVQEELRASTDERLIVCTSLAAQLPAVLARPRQVEKAVRNLAANAREAMPTGGTLVFDTAVVTIEADYAAARPDLPPGRYVRLRVGDSGAGMTPEVMEYAFEPFYTTKASGPGTGLGLATVAGIASQCGGTVVLDSRQGLGTTVAVLLPIAADTGPPEPAVPPPVRGNGETVLVVTPEADLREVTRKTLSTAGYRVLWGGNGAHGLTVAANHPGEIALVLSDVVMPGMLGTDLATRLAAQRPDIRTLHMSWFSPEVLVSRGVVGPGELLLAKPFTGRELLGAVGQRLAHG